MSWQAFVDNHLMVELSSGYRLTSAAIAGQDGYVWSHSLAFPKVMPEEITKIMKGFVDSTELGEYGIHLGGMKYIFIQSDPGEVIRGKKGHGGITIKKSFIFGQMMQGIHNLCKVLYKYPHVSDLNSCIPLFPIYAS